MRHSTLKQFVAVLPRRPRSPSEPKIYLKAMHANIEWFDKYLGGSAAAGN